MDGHVADQIVSTLKELNATLGRIADALDRAHPKPQRVNPAQLRGSGSYRSDYYEGPYGTGRQDR